MTCRALLWLGIPVLLAFPCAMLLYPGEPWGPGIGRGYSFSMEFLSALGRQKTVEGISNPMASTVFNGALVGCGLLYSVFFWPGRGAFIARRAWRAVTLACGWIMAFGLAGIGLAPYDSFPKIHDAMCSVALGAGYLAILTSLVTSGNRFEPAISRWSTAGALCAVVAAALIVRIGIESRWLASRPAMPLLQKGVVSLMIAWTYWQVWLMSRAGRSCINAPVRRSTDA